SGQDQSQLLGFDPRSLQPLRPILQQRDQVLETAAKDVQASGDNLGRALVFLEGVGEVEEYFIGRTQITLCVLSGDPEGVKDSALRRSGLLRVGLSLRQTA